MAVISCNFFWGGRTKTLPLKSSARFLPQTILLITDGNSGIGAHAKLKSAIDLFRLAAVPNLMSYFWNLSFFTLARRVLSHRLIYIRTLPQTKRHNRAKKAPAAQQIGDTREVRDEKIITREKYKFARKNYCQYKWVIPYFFLPNFVCLQKLQRCKYFFLYNRKKRLWT